MVDFTNGAIFYESEADNLALAAAGNGVFYTSGYDNLAVVTKAGMTITCGTGFARVNNTLTGNAADDTLTVTAADATYPRTDLVSIKSDGTITLTAGTAGPTAIPPAVPSNEVLLAYVSVPAGVTTITTAMITDKRVFINNKPLRYLYGDDTTSTTTQTSYTEVKATTIPAFAAPSGMLIMWNLLSYYVSTTGTGKSVANGRIKVATVTKRTADSVGTGLPAAVAYPTTYVGESIITPVIETTDYTGTGTVALSLEMMKTDTADYVGGAACSQFIVLGW